MILKNCTPGFSLVEVIIACVIIGLLATLAIPQFSRVKERSVDKEAIGYLSALQAAERMYFTEREVYYPSPAVATNVVTDINTNLQVNLPTGTNPKWTYTVSSTGGVSALRNGGSRQWDLAITADTATCTPGASDPCR